MDGFSLNSFNKRKTPIIFYCCFFYFTQFTYVGDYFDNWIMPSSYLVIIFGVLILFTYPINRLLIKYFIISLIPLSFDIILNIGLINYWLFAAKYSLVFLIFSGFTYSNNHNPLKKASRIIFNFYLLSFVVSIPFLLGYNIFPELDPSVLRKNSEGNGQSDLYSVTVLFSGYLTGEFPIRILDLPIHRFTSFHIEPSNFTLYFVPITIINWKYLNYFKKILASLMILFSFSVTSFLVLSIIFIVKSIFNTKRNRVIRYTLLITLFIGALSSSNYIFKNTSIGKFVYYKVFESTSVNYSLSQINILDLSYLFSKNSFNEIPNQSQSFGVNPISILLWIFYLFSVVMYSYKKNTFNSIAILYFLMHGLKAITHIYPSFFLLYLLFLNNKEELIHFPIEKKISNYK